MSTHTPEAGDAAPEFDLPAINTPSGRIASAALRGHPYVLYFYPKADTPGCTRQACGFQSALAGFATTGRSLTVIGVSKDSPAALRRFADKHDLRFALAADETGTLIEACGAWVSKSMYGRSYMGIDRSTFLIDAQGLIAQVWRKVKVPGHVEDVLEAAMRLHAE